MKPLTNYQTDFSPLAVTEAFSMHGVCTHAVSLSASVASSDLYRHVKNHL